jgi:hypothetical protein
MVAIALSGASNVMVVRVVLLRRRLSTKSNLVLSRPTARLGGLRFERRFTRGANALLFTSTLLNGALRRSDLTARKFFSQVRNCHNSAALTGVP